MDALLRFLPTAPPCPCASSLLSTVCVQVGGTFENWTLQAVFQDASSSQALAVLEYNFRRWGVFVFRSVRCWWRPHARRPGPTVALLTAPPLFSRRRGASFSLMLRKSVGRLEGLDQPTRHLSGWFPGYNAEIFNNATDLIRAYALRESDEPEYTTFNK